MNPGRSAYPAATHRRTASRRSSSPHVHLIPANSVLPAGDMVEQCDLPSDVRHHAGRVLTHDVTADRDAHTVGAGDSELWQRPVGTGPFLAAT